jgi:hypothetical protein
MVHKVKVSKQDLIDAYSSNPDQMRHYLNLKTGHVAAIAEDDEFMMDDPEDVLYNDDYIELPQTTSHEGYQNMEDFIETVADSTLQKMLSIAIQGKGAFRRFKDVLLDYPDERQRWFDFESAAQMKRIQRWLDAHEIELVEA